MFTHSTISSCLSGLIGFQQSYNQDHAAIDSDLAKSATGMVINHPLFTYENILAVAEQFSRTSVKIYSNTVTYQKNDVVKSDEDIYQSLINENINQVVSDATKWRKTNLISAFLRRIYTNSTLSLFNRVFTEKKLHGVAKSLLGAVSLFEGVGNISGRIIPSGRVVGFRIRVNKPDITATLHAIGLQVDTAQDLNLYLFHSSSDAPLRTFAINQTYSVRYQLHQVESEILGFMTDAVNAGGSYYLVYYEDDLQPGTSMIRKDMLWTGENNCGSCSEGRVNSTRYAQRSRLVDVQPFYVNSGHFTQGELWDEDSEILINDSNFGLNLQISVQCDVSNWICQNKAVWTEPLNRQITHDLLQEMTFSLRDNQKKEKIAQLAASALDNQEGGQYGEAKKLEKAIQAMSFDLSGFDSICLPCENNQIFTKRSVWS